MYNYEGNDPVPVETTVNGSTAGNSSSRFREIQTWYIYRERFQFVFNYNLELKYFTSQHKNDSCGFRILSIQEESVSDSKSPFLHTV